MGITGVLQGVFWSKNRQFRPLVNADITDLGNSG
jgi:hypothetical protein